MTFDGGSMWKAGPRRVVTRLREVLDEDIEDEESLELDDEVADEEEEVEHDGKGSQVQDKITNIWWPEKNHTNESVDVDWRNVSSWFDGLQGGPI